jgi:uncharacterized protein YqeY
LTLLDRLQAEVKNAMRAHDELRRDTLRMALSAAQNAEKAARRPLTDDEMLSVFTKEVKSRRESVEAYEKAGREDLAAKERAEVEILGEFLPQQLSEDELRVMVRYAIAESGASSARDMGKVMGLLSPRTRNRADGRQVSAMVAQELARADLAAHSGGHSESDGPSERGPESAKPRIDAGSS